MYFCLLMVVVLMVRTQEERKASILVEEEGGVKREVDYVIESEGKEIVDLGKFPQGEGFVRVRDELHPNLKYYAYLRENGFEAEFETGEEGWFEINLPHDLEVGVYHLVMIGEGQEEAETVYAFEVKDPKLHAAAVLVEEKENIGRFFYYLLLAGILYVGYLILMHTDKNKIWWKRILHIS